MEFFDPDGKVIDFSHPMTDQEAFDFHDFLKKETRAVYDYFD